mgnify:CR=1 FL=1
MFVSIQEMILKNEILGIDETLRKTFSTAIFATLGGFSLLIASELVEDLLGGGGLIGAVVVGFPLVLLRKPIFFLEITPSIAVVQPL